MKEVIFGLLGIIAGLFIRFVIIEPFKKNDQNKFLLVTSPEDAPPGTALYETRQKQINGEK